MSILQLVCVNKNPKKSEILWEIDYICSVCKKKYQTNGKVKICACGVDKLIKIIK